MRRHQTKIRILGARDALVAFGQPSTTHFLDEEVACIDVFVDLDRRLPGTAALFETYVFARVNRYLPLVFALDVRPKDFGTGPVFSVALCRETGGLLCDPTVPGVRSIKADDLETLTRKLVSWFRRDVNPHLSDHYLDVDDTLINRLSSHTDVSGAVLVDLVQSTLTRLQREDHGSLSLSLSAESTNRGTYGWGFGSNDLDRRVSALLAKILAPIDPRGLEVVRRAGVTKNGVAKPVFRETKIGRTSNFNTAPIQYVFQRERPTALERAQAHLRLTQIVSGELGLESGFARACLTEIEALAAEIEAKADA